MGIKYKLKLKDLKLEYLKEYFSPILKYLKPKRKIDNFNDLQNFIQKKSAWISQVTLYGYLKTRMGAKHVLMFEDEIFLQSINTAKWNIYVASIQDLTLFTISYIKNVKNFDNTEKAKDIFFQILKEEKLNNIPEEIYEKGIKKFEEKFNNVDWSKHYLDLPFNDSSLALYEWSPIAEELKELDKKIVLNSMILKWDNVKKEFLSLLNF